jgi:thiamine pyrophosphokinase
MGKICLLECLKPSACKIGLIFLHTELTNEEVAYHRRKFEILWRNSVFTCAADSGGNFLYDHFCKTADGKVLENPWLPDLISGDFDSLHKAALDFFQTFPNVRVEHTPDQDETDFTKALRLVVEEIRKKDLKVSTHT